MSTTGKPGKLDKSECLNPPGPQERRKKELTCARKWTKKNKRGDPANKANWIDADTPGSPDEKKPESAANQDGAGPTAEGGGKTMKTQAPRPGDV